MATMVTKFGGFLFILVSITWLALLTMGQRSAQDYEVDIEMCRWSENGIKCFYKFIGNPFKYSAHACVTKDCDGSVGAWTTKIVNEHYQVFQAKTFHLEIKEEEKGPHDIF